MNKYVVVFIGIAGSGKTTIAKQLCSDGEFVRISSGDIVRAIHLGMSKEDVESDKEFIKKYGLSIHNDKINSKIFDEINKISSEGKVPVLDGFPRTIDQFNILTMNIKNVMCVKVVVHIAIAMDRIIKRGREDSVDCENIVKAQSKQVSSINEYLSDYTEHNYMPIIEILNNSFDGVNYAAQTIKNYFYYNKESNFTRS